MFLKFILSCPSCFNSVETKNASSASKELWKHVVGVKWFSDVKLFVSFIVMFPKLWLGCRKLMKNFSPWQQISIALAILAAAFYFALQTPWVAAPFG